MRRDDIPILVDHFLKKFASNGGVLKTMSKDCMTILMRYDWPGNVRELENVIERAVILSDSSQLITEDLPERVLRGDKRKGSLIIDCPEMTLEELEREYILKVLNYTGWQKKRASTILGINASTLYRKLQAYKLEGLGINSDSDDMLEDEVQEAA